LTLVGGIQRNSSDKVKGSARLGVESNMGFFQYENNNSDPTEILTDVTKRLIGGSYGFLNEKGRGVRQVAVETYDSIFQKLPNPEFRILFFPSCGVIFPSPEVSKDSASATIRMYQGIADGTWSVMTGRRLSNTSKHMNRLIQKRSGMSGSSSRVFVDSYNSYRAARGAAGPVYGSGPVDGSGPVYGIGGGGGGGGGDMEGGRRQKYRSMRNPRKTKKKRKPSKHTRRH